MTKKARTTTSAKARQSKTDKARKKALAEIGKRLGSLDGSAATGGGPKAPPKLTAAKGRPGKPAKPAAGAKDGKASAPARSKAKRPSALDAAATVLAGAKKPMRTKELVEAMRSRGLWTSPAGKTPHATLHAAISREIADKGKHSRFKKAGRGLFARAAAS